VISNDRSFVIDAVADDGVPAGVAAIALNQSATGPTTVIDIDAAVTDVRLEAGA
jgi:hypothetical protein